MIGALREWLCSVLTVTLLLSVVELLLPEGNMRKIGGFTGGLVLLLTLLSPVKGLRSEIPELRWDVYEQAIIQRQEELSAVGNRELRELIESRSAAYISDKADSLGISVTVRVRAEENAEGIPVPEWVEITGVYSAELAAWLESELAVPAERQVWNEGKN
ncbi:MAG: stage III sporulation protein AF [Ruminococcaceae bacterium]|nr:stage III sporulation protein AF [Oscillospiraceae bacterium]